jgi:iron-sulfur cluster insertion protein
MPDNAVIGKQPQEIPMSALAEHTHTADPVHALATSDEPPVPLVFTDSAANKVKELVDEEGNPELKLRVFVQGGGCSGFQYGFTFDEIVNDDDTQMSKNGVTLLIDAMSLQ